ncbi:thioredoxin family protein [Candidatus Saccharibacteria bacterium]|nr:thioredoxin family protein [Candidatus Saccharibacteria bacterium]
MNKKIIFLTIGIIIIIGAALTYVLLTPSKKAETTETTQSLQTPATSSDQSTSELSTLPERTGTYVDYSESAVATATGTKLLFFYAPWCPQCRSVDTSIIDGKVPADVTVFKVDYDSNQALRQKYGVTLQTTFVKIDANGQKIDSYVAYEEPNFASVEIALLR